jgi:hypothetical protein
MTHIVKTALSSDNLATLDTLKSNVDFLSNSIRLGVNNYSNLSKYEVSKWKGWTRTQRSTFKSCFADEDINKAVIGYFLKFPANTGLLDDMNAWDGESVAGTIVAYSLTDNNTITIDNQVISLDRGQGVEFSLTNIHSVSTSSAERNWACLMLMK